MTQSLDQAKRTIGERVADRRSRRADSAPCTLGVDALVASRELYGLTEEGIKIVEGRLDHESRESK